MGYRFTQAADFNDNKMPQEGSNHTCLGTISRDSALKKRWKLLSGSPFDRMQIHWKIGN